MDARPFNDRVVHNIVIDGKVALEGAKGENTKGLKTAQKNVKKYDVAMSAEQIQRMRDELQIL